MSHDWLQDLRNKGAYYCRDPEKFLKHVEESESRKKFYFKEELTSGRIRLWMIVEGISPIVLSNINFDRENDLQKWVQQRLKDFVEFAPLSVAFADLASDG